ncbi:MAG TPA: DUF5666 domain-containing protein [Candidatus Paceibacterota bacterium]|nr:DUF5666 domain-containing protein [Candidatus Paceibacterota bacterium]
MASPIRKLIVIGAASVALAAAGIVPSYALASQNPRTNAPAGHRRFGGGRFGTVSGVDGSSITLATHAGATYTIDAGNARIIKAGSDAPLSAVTVGDPIAVFGTTTAPETIDARVIVDGPPARRAKRGGIIGGVVGAVSAGTFTLTPKGHPGRPPRPAVTVVTDTETVVTKAGQSIPFTSLASGIEIIVSGTRESNGTFLASKIIIRNR